MQICNTIDNVHESQACFLIYAGDRPLQWKGLSLLPWTEAGRIITIP